jgi:hypothetical protein
LGVYKKIEDLGEVQGIYEQSLPTDPGFGWFINVFFAYMCASSADIDCFFGGRGVSCITASQS